MSNVYIYSDKNKMIHEISLQPRGDLLEYTTTVIPFNDAAEFLKLYRKCQINGNITDPMHLLEEENGKYVLRKTVYIYYHHKDMVIKSITPRRQQNLDENMELKVGSVAIDELINDFIDGKKAPINYKINDEQKLLTIEKIIDRDHHKNFIDYINVLEDYKLNRIDEYLLTIEHKENGMLNIIKHDDLLNSRNIELYFVGLYDKTEIFYKTSFMFLENENQIYLHFDIPHEFLIISPDYNIINYIRA